MKKTIFLTMVATLLSNAQILDAFYQLKPKKMKNKECKSGKKATLNKYLDDVDLDTEDMIAGEFRTI